MSRRLFIISPRFELRMFFHQKAVKHDLKNNNNNNNNSNNKGTTKTSLRHNRPMLGICLFNFAKDTEQTMPVLASYNADCGKLITANCLKLPVNKLEVSGCSMIATLCAVQWICCTCKRSYFTTICKVGDRIPTLHQSDCRISNYSTGVQIVSCTLSDDSVLSDNPVLCVSQWNLFWQKNQPIRLCLSNQVRPGRQWFPSPLADFNRLFEGLNGELFKIWHWNMFYFFKWHQSGP